MKTGGCPKCGGDVFTEFDIYGTEDQCLQCGYVVRTIAVPRYQVKTDEVVLKKLAIKDPSAHHAAIIARNKEILKLVEAGATHKQAGLEYSLKAATIKEICAMERLKLKKEQEHDQ